jgi:hypothetical protein
MGNLVSHMAVHSEPTEPHYCVECDLHFETAHKLEYHLKYSAKHIDPSKFQ